MGFVSLNVVDDPGQTLVFSSTQFTVTAEPEPLTAPCDFCGKTGHVFVTDRYGWHVCVKSDLCNRAVSYHIERVQACLVDCEETRRATLNWVQNRS